MIRPVKITALADFKLRVDYADVVNAGTTNWLMLATLTLPSSPYLVIDQYSPGQVKRFYRAVPLP